MQRPARERRHTVATGFIRFAHLSSVSLEYRRRAAWRWRSFSAGAPTIHTHTDRPSAPPAVAHTGDPMVVSGQFRGWPRQHIPALDVAKPTVSMLAPVLNLASRLIFKLH